MPLIIVTANRVLRLGCEEIQRHVTPGVAFVGGALKHGHQFDDRYVEFLERGVFLPDQHTCRIAACLSSGQDTWSPEIHRCLDRLQKVVILASVLQDFIRNADSIYLLVVSKDLRRDWYHPLTSLRSARDFQFADAIG